MADCGKIKQLMMMQIDNEISEQDKLVFEKHIASCQSCEQEFNSLVSMISEINSLKEIELPHNFHEEAMEKIRQSKEKSFNIYSWRQYSSIAAVFLLTFMLIASATAGLDLLLTDNMKSAQDAASELSSLSVTGNGGGAELALPTLAPSSEVSEPMGGEATSAPGQNILSNDMDEVNMSGNIEAGQAMLFGANPEDGDVPMAAPSIEPPAPSDMDFEPLMIETETDTNQDTNQDINQDTNQDSLQGYTGAADEPSNMKIAQQPLDDEAELADGAVPMMARGVEPMPSPQKELLTINYGLEEKNVKNYSITIEVDDIDTAMSSISTLSGYSVSSSINKRDNDRGYAAVSQAVDDSQFYITVSALKNMGDVITENQGQYSVLNNSKDAYSHYIVKLEEKNRLMELLAKTETVENMLTVENRMNTVISELEAYKNQIDHWNEISSSPIIEISLIEKYKPEEKTAPNETPFGERVLKTFRASIGGVVAVSKGATIAFAYLFLPVLVLGVCIFVVFWVKKKFRR